jgi:hypothetical protein
LTRLFFRWTVNRRQPADGRNQQRFARAGPDSEGAISLPSPRELFETAAEDAATTLHELSHYAGFRIMPRIFVLTF